MAFSVLFHYQASFPSTDLHHIFGADNHAREIIDVLSSSKFELIENDLWNDCGWYITVENSGVNLSIYLAKYEANEKWQLTIEQNVSVSLIDRLLGKREESFKGPLKALCILVEKYLLSEGVMVNELEICFSTDVKRTTDSVSRLAW